MATRRPASLKVRALQWLAQREHSPVELRIKLLRAAAGQPVPAVSDAQPLSLDDADVADADDSGPAAKAAAVAEVDALLDWLTANAYLSTERFVESRIHARQARFGNQRITQELQQHGLRLEPEARQALRDSELARAQELWQRKYGEPAVDAAGRLRQMRFLAGRGFSHAVVQRVVRGIGGPSDD
jgi:regulatory protein